MKKQRYLLGIPIQLPIPVPLLPRWRIHLSGLAPRSISALQLFLANIKPKISQANTLISMLSGYESIANALPRLAGFRDYKSRSTE
jgi:hypothetical protein